MAQADPAPIISSVPPHSWSLDADTRKLVDFARSGCFEIADDYLRICGKEIRENIRDVVEHIECAMGRIASGGDHDRLAAARTVLIETAANVSSTTLDEIAGRVMNAAALLMTGVRYFEGDAPDLSEYRRAA